MLSSPMGTVPSLWIMAMPFRPCFATISLHIESMVRSARALYEVYCSSLTGLPAKLSRVVPGRFESVNSKRVLKYEDVEGATCEEDDGSGSRAANFIHDGLDVEFVFCQGGMAYAFGHMPCSILIRHH